MLTKTRLPLWSYFTGAMPRVHPPLSAGNSERSFGNSTRSFVGSLASWGSKTSSNCGPH